MPISIKNMLSIYVKGLMNIIERKVDQVILYGSYAKGNQNQDGEISDVDIMILVNCQEDEVKEIQKKVLDYSYEYDLEYSVLLSPIVETTENYNKKIEYMEFYKKIKEEGVLLSA